MNPTTRKGQTALEYLLIVVVAIIIVVAVMVWMQGTQQATEDRATDTVGNVMCATYMSNATCNADDNCAWNAATGTCEAG